MWNLGCFSDCNQKLHLLILASILKALVSVCLIQQTHIGFAIGGVHKDELPQMAAAARDFLPIPASEVAVERLFNMGRDVLGIRRHSMKADTMRILMLMNDI